jgi:hypothetical protein
MNAIRKSQFQLGAMLAVVTFASVASAADVAVTLSGSQEVPAVKTDASGNGTITVNADKTLSGIVTTKRISGTAAHIHEAATGKNGGVAIPLENSGVDTWRVPAGAMLTDEQYRAYQAGDLYVNVHSAAHPDGEIRGQLKPGM